MKVKKILVLLFLLTTAPAIAQVDLLRAGMCMNPSGNWIFINAATSGSSLGYAPAPFVGLYGSNNGGAAGGWFPVQCDANGNLTALPPGWTVTGSGASQVVTAPGTVAVGTAVSFASQAAAAATVANLGQIVSLANVPGIDTTCAADDAPAITSYFSTLGCGSPITVLVPPGCYKLTTQVVQHTCGVTLLGAGGVFHNYVTNTDMWQIGTNAAHVYLYSGNAFNNVTVQSEVASPHIAFMDAGLGTTFQRTHFINTGSNRFHYLVSPNNDQRFLFIDNDLNGDFLQCDSSFCGFMVWSSGYATSGVGYSSATALPTTTNHSGAGATITIDVFSTGIHGGTIVSGGSGYSAGDILYPTQTGGSGGSFTVSSVSGDVVAGITLNTNYGDFDASVGNFINNHLRPACMGNGIRWDSGNGLSLIGSIVEAFAQIGVEYTGGLDPMVMGDKVHIESGDVCPNPAMGGRFSSVGWLINGSANLTLNASSMDGGTPNFPVTGTPGTTSWVYYVVANSTDGTASFPLGAGFVTNGPALVSGGASPFAGGQSIPVMFPPIPAASSCDVLVQNADYGSLVLPGVYQAPYPGNAWSIATGLTCNGSSAITVNDTGLRTAYTFPDGNKGRFAPYLPYWPGNVVLAQGSSFKGDSVYGVAGFVNETNGNNYYGGSATPITLDGAGTIFNDAASLIVPTARVFAPQRGAATLYSTSQLTTTGLTGTLNTQGPNPVAGDAWTLYTANYQQLQATTAGIIPAATGDTAIGFDGTGMSLRAGTEICSYINHLGDNPANALECLTGTTKSIKTANFVLSNITGLPSSGYNSLRIDSAGNITGGQASIANIQTTVASATFNSGTCSSATTATMTGVVAGSSGVPGSTFNFTSLTDSSGITGWGSSGGLVIDAWPTANTLNYKVCNQSAANITSGSITFNVSAR